MIQSAENETVNVSVVAVLQNGRAELSEQFQVRAGSLDETLSVLKRFHDLAEQIRDEQAGVARGGGVRSAD